MLSWRSCTSSALVTVYAVIALHCSSHAFDVHLSGLVAYIWGTELTQVRDNTMIRIRYSAVKTRREFPKNAYVRSISKTVESIEASSVYQLLTTYRPRLFGWTWSGSDGMLYMPGNLWHIKVELSTTQCFDNGRHTSWTRVQSVWIGWCGKILYINWTDLVTYGKPTKCIDQNCYMPNQRHITI